MFREELRLRTLALDGPVVVHPRTTESAALPQVPVHHIALRVPVLAGLVVGPEVRVHGDGGVAIAHLPNELHHLVLVVGDTVAGHGDVLPATAHPHVAAGEVVHHAGGGLDPDQLPVHVVQLEHAAAVLGGAR